MAGDVRAGGGPVVSRRELLGFAGAGLLAYAVDLGLFLWLRGPAGLGPLTAKALSFVAGCTVAYVGNALGTYRHRRTKGLRPYAVFLAVHVVGALVQLLCLAVSHYGLGLTSQRADTVSGAGIGMALATVLRFWGARTLVFGRGAADEIPSSTRGSSETVLAGRASTE
ncbi:GtrA family protein [Streptomyces sp. NPDC004752]